MDYSINTTDLVDRIEREISRVAASSYSDDGGSLYDAIKVTSRDRDILQEFSDGAVSSICSALFDIATFKSASDPTPENPGGTTPENPEGSTPEASSVSEEESNTAVTSQNQISFDVPDFDESMASNVSYELSKYIVNYACAEWFKDKSAKDVELYTSRASDALAKANILLKSRKAPKRK